MKKQNRTLQDLQEQKENANNTQSEHAHRRIYP